MSEPKPGGGHPGAGTVLGGALVVEDHDGVWLLPIPAGIRPNGRMPNIAPGSVADGGPDDGDVRLFQLRDDEGPGQLLAHGRRLGPLAQWVSSELGEATVDAPASVASDASHEPPNRVMPHRPGDGQHADPAGDPPGSG